MLSSAYAAGARPRPWTRYFVAALHRETQPELLRLSSNSAQVVAANSDHFIQRDAPDLVVAAVHEVVDAARAHRHVDGSVLSSLTSKR
jgi:hypothetical protein